MGPTRELIPSMTSGGRLLPRPWIGAVALLVMCSLMLSATPKSTAAPAPEFLLQFCDPGEDAGQCSGPAGVAANPTNGHVYVSEVSSARVSEFTSWGVLVRAFGWGVDTGAAELQSCTTASSCQAGQPGDGSGQLNEPWGVAVDSMGNIYVVDRGNLRIQKFNPAGEFELMFGKGVNTGTSGNANLCTNAGPPTDICGPGETGIGPGEFSPWPERSTIAVGPGDKVYVGDANRIQRFSSGGVYEAEIPLTGKGLTEAIAVVPTSGDIYVVSQNLPGKVSRFTAGGAPKNFTAGPAAGTNILTAVTPGALSVDSAGVLYVVSGSSNPRNVVEFAASGLELVSFNAGVFNSTGIATNPKGTIYVGSLEAANNFVRAFGPEPDYEAPPDAAPQIGAEWTSSAGSTSATVKAELSPNFWTTRYYVQYGPEDCETALEPCDEEPLSPGIALAAKRGTAAVSVTLNDLTPGTLYHFRFVAESDAPTAGGPVFGADRTFSTFSPPVVAPELDGRVYEMVSPPDKGGGEAGIPTGTPGGLNSFSVAPKQSSPDGEAITYTSFNSFGETEGAPATGQYLSTREGGRWSTENMNPRFEEGYLRDPIVGLVPDLSKSAVIALNPPLAPGARANTWSLYQRDGKGNLSAITTDEPDLAAGQPFCVGYAGASDSFDRIFFMAQGSFLEAPVVNGVNLYEWHSDSADGRQLLTVRATGGEYTLTATAARGKGALVNGSTEVTEVEVTAGAGAFHVGDMIAGTGIPPGTTVLSTKSSEGKLTLSAPATTTAVQKLTATESTSPLPVGDNASTVQSGLEGLAAIGPGNVAVTGGPGDATGSTPYSIEFTGDLSGTYVHNLKATGIGLSGGSPSSTVAMSTSEPGGHVRLLSILPTGVPATPFGTTSFGAAPGVSPACNMSARAMRHAISDDGSRVFWTYNFIFPGGNFPLFARVFNANGEPKTIQLDASQGGAGKGAGKFQDASVDGSKVFFLDTQKLTAVTSASGSDLYRYDMVKGEKGEPEPLSNLTAHAGEPANVQGVLGTSEKGDYVYFAANGVLTAALNPSTEDGAVPGQPNIYAWHEGEPLRFIATLTNTTPDTLNWRTNLTEQTSRVSPNGRHLVFVSTKDLTGYDNTDQITGTLDSQVFVYNLAAERLSCVSCNPTGARPGGFSAVPNWSTPYEQPRYLLDDGRVFFESRDALDPHDVNGEQDVYAFQRSGVGNCSAASASFSGASGGCLGLVSTGSSSSRSYFLDASTDGRDVFFSTRQSLVPQDVDGASDVYDFRIGGTPPPPPPPGPCEGEACRGPGTSAPPVPAPGTNALLAPPTNREKRTCRRGKVRRKGRCVARKCPAGKAKRKGRCVAKKRQLAHRRHQQAGANRRTVR
jgi:hypothetical protein